MRGAVTAALASHRPATHWQAELDFAIVAVAGPAGRMISEVQVRIRRRSVHPAFGFA
jgi:hypothetical protein